MNTEPGVLTISLDFELSWGLLDAEGTNSYIENVRGVPEAIDNILNTFDKYDVHATWATVGFVFAENIEELRTALPSKKPEYVDSGLNPYIYIRDVDSVEHRTHFGRHILKNIQACKNQEIGTHTFSHYYCLEPGQSAEHFRDDIVSAKRLAEKSGVRLNSLVFPRNQCNDEYLAILSEQDISSYRGVENSWMYQASETDKQGLVRRAFRLMDSYLNISGPNTFSLSSIAPVKPYNIPSSRFLRPVPSKLQFLESFRKRRIIRAIRHAAKMGEVFHLWWHPHNFGKSVEENIKFLDEVLIVFDEMREKYGMVSMNMEEISKQVETRASANGA